MKSINFFSSEGIGLNSGISFMGFFRGPYTRDKYQDLQGHISRHKKLDLENQK